MKRTLYVTSAAAAAVLLAGGTVAAAAASTAGAAAATAAASPLLPAQVDAEEAAAAAVKHYPGVIESFDKDGPVWHVDVVGKDGRHAELLVDAASGKVTLENTDEDSDSNEDAALLAAEVTAQEATKAALAARPGQVQSVEWYNDDATNVRYWSVEIESDGKTQNVHVDPTSAKVTTSPDSDENDEDN